MARPKKTAAVPLQTPADQKQYQVIQKFTGSINLRPFICATGDLIMLNPFEAECLKTYIKETE